MQAGRPDPASAQGLGDGINLDDLLGGLFGGRVRGGFGTIPGADHEAELEVTVEEAYRGTQRTVSLGTAEGTRTLDVTIPAGVTNGQRIRLAGQGGQGSGGARAGDLYLVVRIAPHPRYRVQGRDVSTDLLLAPWEAALGTSVAVDLPDGEAKVTVPAGTSSGRRLRLRGRGLPNPSGKPGDLLAEAKIMVPRRLSRKERRLFEELAAESSFDPRKAAMSYALVRPVRLDLATLSRASRACIPTWFAAWSPRGALDAYRDAAGTLWFGRDQLAILGRIQRLRTAFALNYAALGLVIDLLDRIEVLEAALRGRPRQTGGHSWTPAA